MAWSALPWPCHRCDFHRALAQHQPRSRTHNTARKVPKVRRPPGHELINAHRAGHQAVWRHFENCSSISTTCRVGLHTLLCTMPQACWVSFLISARHRAGGLLLHELLEGAEATPIRLQALCEGKQLWSFGASPDSGLAIKCSPHFLHRFVQLSLWTGQSAIHKMSQFPENNPIVRHLRNANTVMFQPLCSGSSGSLAACVRACPCGALRCAGGFAITRKVCKHKTATLLSLPRIRVS